MAQFRFVAVIQMVGCEPVKVTVCPDYAASLVVNRWDSQPGASIRVVDIDSHWATTILHTTETADTDGQ